MLQSQGGHYMTSATAKIIKGSIPTALFGMALTYSAIALLVGVPRLGGAQSMA